MKILAAASCLEYGRFVLECLFKLSVYFVKAGVCQPKDLASDKRGLPRLQMTPSNIDSALSLVARVSDSELQLTGELFSNRVPKPREALSR